MSSSNLNFMPLVSKARTHLLDSWVENNSGITWCMFFQCFSDIGEVCFGRA